MAMKRRSSASLCRARAIVPAVLLLLGGVACTRSEAAPRKNDEPGAAAAPTATAQPLAGDHVDGKNFRLDAVVGGDCQVGAECRILIRLEALGEYHINKEYPYKFKAESKREDVEFLGTDPAGKNTFSKAAGDFRTDTEQKATLTVRFKPGAAGALTVFGTYKMSVCSAQNCQLESQPLSVDLEVKS